jgi:hypothetical protein
MPNNGLRKISEETRSRLSASHIGQVPWNKGMRGFKHSGSFQKGHVDFVPIESRTAAGEKMSNEKHPGWKGDRVGYAALHIWVARHKEKPKRCEHCGKDGLTGRKIQWANKSKKYLRDLSDWIPLCVKCHFLFDNYPYHAK